MDYLLKKMFKTFLKSFISFTFSAKPKDTEQNKFKYTVHTPNIENIIEFIKCKGEYYKR